MRHHFMTPFLTIISQTSAAMLFGSIEMRTGNAAGGTAGAGDRHVAVDS